MLFEFVFFMKLYFFFTSVSFFSWNYIFFSLLQWGYPKRNIWIHDLFISHTAGGLLYAIMWLFRSHNCLSKEDSSVRIQWSFLCNTSAHWFTLSHNTSRSRPLPDVPSQAMAEPPSVPLRDLHPYTHRSHSSSKGSEGNARRTSGRRGAPGPNAFNSAIVGALWKALDMQDPEEVETYLQAHLGH